MTLNLNLLSWIVFLPVIGLVAIAVLPKYAHVVPARAEGPDLSVETDERRTVGLRAEECRRHPAHGGDRDREQQREVRAEMHVVFRRIRNTTETPKELTIATTSHQALTRHQNQRTRYRRPVPAPTCRMTSKASFAVSSTNTIPEETKKRITVASASRRDVVLLGGIPAHEAPVEIVDEVGSAPVQMREDRGGVGRDQPAHHQADESDRQELQHRRDTRCRGRSGSDPGWETPSGCRRAPGRQ